MSWWDIAGVALTVAVFGGGAVWVLTAKVPAMASVEEYRTDERLWEELRTQGVRTEAVVRRLTRPQNRLGTSGRTAYTVAAVDLLLSFRDGQGVEREASVSTFIEADLLTNFFVGKTVAIVYSAHDPDIAAIDRERTLLEIPATPPR
ncbi:hypothetical protein QFZ42_004840 [Variovorax paradoxus]|uniref:hypothetical protein n=1 Tax=Variovorax paradoxus TaxID=34073 RepID=UPI00278EC196|nr:hypothetical protein [Variovorax paradoxus]MDQ0573006.1 hypothetical protein [Variovorax paradoxus]